MINGHNETQRRLKKIYDNIPDNDVYYNKKEGYYIKSKYKPYRALKLMKKYNNKRIRQNKTFIADGCYYKKINEHWWRIY